ncbi:MAG: helix-turn-helix domain-containing protein [Desulfatiglandales bacterium]
MESNGKPTLKNVLTENDLTELLGLTKGQISDLRLKKGLPFIKVNQNSRLYLEDDLIEFFLRQRVVLNQGETEQD